MLAHYSRVGPLLEHSFAGDPIVFANFPAGFNQPPRYHVTDVALATRKLLWLVHRYYALEYHGWAPLPSDDDRLRFARILLECAPDTPFDRIRSAAIRLREHLLTANLDAVALLDGWHGIALWIPLADAPRADAVRAWLHPFCEAAVAADPALFTTRLNTVDRDRIHLHVSSNAARRFSALPYSLRGEPSLPVVTPVTWDELPTAEPHSFTATTFEKRLERIGNVFATEVARIGKRVLPTVGAPDAVPLSVDSAPRGHVIVAAIAILEDGAPRSADAILAAALANHTVPPQTTRKYVYTALIEYIARQLGRGRKPAIVQDAERNFRINEPPDDWPDVVAPSQVASDAATEALLARLESTAHGDDPSAFEFACCDAFAQLGFRTRRLGAHAEPDGIADAQLGPLGYRALLECKTAKTVVTQPDAAEAAKFLPAYRADVATMIGPHFTDETQVAQEFLTHGVAALTVADLSALLSIGANALEMRAILTPGFVSERVGDLVWERRHGHVKRVATIAELVQRAAWDAQRTAALQEARAEAPRLTVDAAMLLVDAALHVAGSAQACAREDVEAAFAHLSDPLIGIATWLDPERTALVVLVPPRDA